MQVLFYIIQTFSALFKLFLHYFRSIFFQIKIISYVKNWNKFKNAALEFVEGRGGVWDADLNKRNQTTLQIF